VCRGALVVVLLLLTLVGKVLFAIDVIQVVVVSVVVLLKFLILLRLMVLVVGDQWCVVFVGCWLTMAGRPVGWRDRSVIGQPLVTMTHVLVAVLLVVG
jgi:hypothetical protein